MGRFAEHRMQDQLMCDNISFRYHLSISNALAMGRCSINSVKTVF